MRNKVAVIVVVLLCLGLTLEKPAVSKAKKRPSEDDSD